MTTTGAIVGDVLDHWKAGILARRPDEVAALFAEDAIFQGLRPYSVGRDGVFDYFAAQPVGLTPTYRILESRRPADGVILGYVDVDFAFTDRPTIGVLLSVLLTRVGEDWSISHYQVSGRPAEG